jgi:hypothetical protein
VSKITTLTYGSPVKTMTSTNTAAAINRLPQVADMVLTYTGDLEAYKWLSLVDSTLNYDNPCLTGTVAAVAADSYNSGAQRATSGTRAVNIPQAAGDLLSEFKSYAVCYAETDGTTSDSTWADSYIRMKISLVQSISSHLLTHTTYGHIASVGSSEVGWDGTSYTDKAVTDLKLTHAGTLSTAKWVTLVDSTLNTIFPCADGNVAAATAGTTQSGPIQTIGYVVNILQDWMHPRRLQCVTLCLVGLQVPPGQTLGSG